MDVTLTAVDDYQQYTTDDHGFDAMSCWWESDAPSERNQIGKGIVQALPISALLWCGLLAVIFHH
ncbi:MAG: hypothetical protein KGJ57_00900 [Sphingomonadales bacterium]|nr:hypothetical protein [Sphingomonadales bacterium]MDE2167968.1 hypothetical protein [Sphingomonadales bacterium]